MMCADVVLEAMKTLTQYRTPRIRKCLSLLNSALLIIILSSIYDSVRFMRDPDVPDRNLGT
jgi:hypothetical protein